MPARPFLAPVAAGMGEDVAGAIGARVAAALRGDSTDGFDPSDVQLVSESGKHPEGLGDFPPEDRRVVEEGLETPGQARAHGLPQIIPGLNSTVPTIPLLGGGPTSATPRSVAPSGQAPGLAAPPRQPSAADRAEFERYQQAMRERMAKPTTTDPALSHAMDEMYRDGASVGSGSTAAAVRLERATGGTVGGRMHTQKAEGYVKFLERWLQRNSAASPGDRAAAENVLRDLRDALAGN